MRSPQSLRGTSMVKSPAGVLYRNPDLGIIFPLRRNWSATITINWTFWSNMQDGTSYFRGLTPNPLGTTSFTQSGGDGTSEASRILTMLQDQRWNQNWRVSFLEIPSLYQYTGTGWGLTNVREYTSSTVQTLYPELATSYVAGVGTWAPINAAGVTSWMNATDAITYLGSPPQESFTGGVSFAPTGYTLVDFGSLDPTEQAALNAIGTPPWYTWGPGVGGNGGVVSTTGNGAAMLADFGGWASYADTGLNELPPDFAPAGPEWETAVTGVLPRLGTLPKFAWFLWHGLEQDLNFPDMTDDPAAALLLAQLNLVTPAAPQPSQVQFWTEYGVPGDLGKNSDYWLAQKTKGKVKPSPGNDPDFYIIDPAYTWRALYSFGTPYLQPMGS